MSTEALGRLVLSVLPGVITILALYLTAVLSLKKFYAEKRLERKEKAYEGVIEALYDMLQYCEIMKEPYGDTGYPGEKMKELQEKYNRAFWEVKRATDIGALVMAHEAVAILKDLRERPKLNWDKNPPWDIYE